MDFLVAGLGLVILLLAGDVLVRGAVNLAIRLGIPALIVSLTIVAFGTSAPELLISVKAVLENSPGIAIGNVVGSNTANILLVLGFPALIAGIKTSETETRRSYLMMIGGSALFIAVCFLGPLTWIHGIILLAGLSFVLMDQTREALAFRAEAGEDEEIEEADPSMPGWKIGVFIALGLVGLPLGADILVEAATNIARRYGVSETAIGLTLVAVGTSLPELATVASAVFRRQTDVILGNVIGSNMFNLLAIIGVAAFFGDIPVPSQFLEFDLWVMLGASLLLAPFVFSKRININRIWGGIFAGLYVVYIFLVLA